jgi:anti-sigma B factor antagonist
MLGFDAIMRSFGVLAEAIEDFKRPVAADVGEEDFLAPEEYGAGEPTVDGGAAARQATQISPDLKVAVLRMQPGPHGTVVIDVDGTVDSSTSDRLEAVLDSCVDEHPASVIVDLGDLVYMSSSGWGLLVKCMQRLGEAGGKLALAGMSSTILKIFRDLGFEPLIQHYPTLERALGKGAPVENIETGPVSPAERAPLPPQGEITQQPATPPDKPQPPAEDVDIASAILGKPDVGPLEPLKTVKGEEKVIFIDFKRRKDVRADKDKHIKKLGWTEYGKKLSESGKDAKNRKKDR